MTKIKRATLAASAIVFAAAASAAAAATPAFPTYAGAPFKGNPAVKPSYIQYVGDGSEFFAGAGRKRAGRLHWTVWNHKEGLGTGYQWIDDCTPNCASGKFSKFPVKLQVDKPRKESRFLIFTRLQVTYTGKMPGHQKSFTWKVSYANGTFEIG